MFAVRFPADGPDQAQAARTLEGKDRQEIGLLEIDMDFAVGRRPGGVHVGDVEQSGIGSTGKARRQRLPDGRMRAIAAGEVGRVADLLRAVRALEDRSHLVGVLLETDQRRAALHVHPPGVEPFDEQALVGVLRVGQRIGKGAQALPHPPQGHARGFGAPDPES